MAKPNDTQEFLDENQYTKKRILLYETIFGPNCLSTGGEDVIENMCKQLNLSPGQKVLDVGCGIGGNSFHLARNYGVQVLGVDLSTNMLSFATERLLTYPEIKHLVYFQQCDITKHEFNEQSFDVIFSKDAILHIKDKESLFRKFLKWLKPGGLLIIGDYNLGERNPSEALCQYVKQRNYTLLTVTDYGKLLEKVGFNKKIVEDRSEFFNKEIEKEVEYMEKHKEKLIQDFSEADYNFVLNGRKAKLECKGSQAWGLFLMEKPINLSLK